MKHVLKSSKHLDARYTVYKQCFEMSRAKGDAKKKQVFRAFHKIYPTLPREVVSGLLTGKYNHTYGKKLQKEGEVDDITVAVISVPDKYGDKNYPSTEETIYHNQVPPEQLVKMTEYTREMSEQQEETTRLQKEEHQNKALEFANIVNDPIKKMIEEGGESGLNLEVLMDGLLIIMKHHIMGTYLQYGDQPELKTYIGAKIGELVAFTIGFDGGNSNTEIPAEGTDEQTETEDIREVGEPEQSSDSEEISTDTEG